MLEFLFFISAKKVVVGCAIFGALIATIAPLLAKYAISLMGPEKPDMKFELLTKLLVRVGYGFVGFSVTLFIIAGFIVDLR